MRISDWSSDVCSSDLVGKAGAQGTAAIPDHDGRPDKVRVVPERLGTRRSGHDDLGAPDPELSKCLGDGKAMINVAGDGAGPEGGKLGDQKIDRVGQMNPYGLIVLTALHHKQDGPGGTRDAQFADTQKAAAP